ncbi:pyruvate kinase 2, cytosolic-like isoform X3 [Camellia sinensis]|nr:pyruvate kinase 2, cytosolic-like isoform X3 [Camellia sinensis]
MHANHLLLEEPIRMASILEPSRANFFPATTKIVGTLGPRSRSVEVISGCLKAGMSVARFDFSLGDPEYHQETLENLRAAVKTTYKLCALENPVIEDEDDEDDDDEDDDKDEDDVEGKCTDNTEFGFMFSTHSKSLY